MKIDRLKIILAVLSGLLLTGSFPKAEICWFAWFALVPLLVSLRDLSAKNSFYLGFLAGFAHYLTLMYWIAYTLEVYGGLPIYLSVAAFFALSAYLALYIAVFSAILSRLCSKPLICLFVIPVLWVSLEYIRSFLFTGFPWGLIGYSQFSRLHIIQISDILGVYGVSFLIAMSNAAIFLAFLYFTRKDWQEKVVPKGLAAGSLIVFILIFGSVWSYGKWRIESIDELISASPSITVAVVQGNIDQGVKWDPAFKRATAEKYVKLSLLTKEYGLDLVVWPETATPFYLLHNTELTEIVKEGIYNTGAHFLIGSPSFVRREGVIEYYNSAYLIGPDGNLYDRYDKVHLVPFGEYIPPPLDEWFPFLDKIVEGAGNFSSGIKGDTISFNDYKLGVQICYEIIFPNLSRAMAKNDATLLVNITNDAWFGKTCAPYQHFSKTVFRAVENRRSLVRSANTGISGFIDPAGRIVAETDLFKDATMTRSMPVIHKATLYTHFGDLFAIACLAAMLLFTLNALKGSVALYGRRRRGQAPTLPQLNLTEICVTMHYMSWEIKNVY